MNTYYETVTKGIFELRLRSDNSVQLFATSHDRLVEAFNRNPMMIGTVDWIPSDRNREMIELPHSLRTADRIEDVLCMATLIAAEVLPAHSTLDDVDVYYKTIGSCDLCPCNLKCLACVINE